MRRAAYLRLATSDLASVPLSPTGSTCNSPYTVELPSIQMEPVYPASHYELNMDLKISTITCHPNDLLVQFQGNYISDCEFDYHILQNEIQLVPKVEASMCVGEFCLVQDKPFGTWNRGKILNNMDEVFEVFLIDQGNIVKVTSSKLASASGDLFTLPPKVVNGIIANLLPVGEKWPPKAINYFSSLVGLQIKGHVQTLLAHQAIVLEIPKVISYAAELNVAKYVDSDSFCFLVEIIHQFPTNSNCKKLPDLLQQKRPYSDFSLCLKDTLPSFQKVLDHLKPNLSIGTIEKVRISAAVSPDKFYCHILSWEEELNNLTAAMTSHYDAIKTKQSSVSDNFGVLCAARRKDGLWHRGLIHKLISGDKVRVWFMDIGSCETVSSLDVQKLQQGFLSLPMMVIPCSLTHLNDQGEDLKIMQLMQIKQGLTGQIVIACIDHFISEENVYSVTLYAKDYEFNAKCHLSNERVPTFSPKTNSCDAAPSKGEDENGTSNGTAAAEAEKEDVDTISYKTVQMAIDSVHIAYVEYVLNPSNFWIRTDECENEFAAMMEDITKLFKSCGATERVLADPVPGQLCCALYAKDRHYYRAVVTEVMNFQVTVYFLDFGNTETVDYFDIKTLPPQFTVLPALAMCCTLAYVYPVEDVWVKSANDFFKEAVLGKALFCHVLAKQKYKYVVDIRQSDSSENSNIVTLLVQAGFAEHWNVILNAGIPDKMSKHPKRRAITRPSYIYVENARSKKLAEITNGPAELNIQFSPKEKPLCSSEILECATSTGHPSLYKQYLFKPGTMIDVKCSRVNSPEDFWCQQLSTCSQLDGLMKDLQNYYSTCKNKYRRGQIACVAKSPCNGTFYRASVRNQVSAKEVDVLSVDYGAIERVLISELREIEPQFLTLRGQAFHCSLSHRISPAGASHTWTSEACRDFKLFVETASETIKCTVHVLFSCDSTGLCNAVNLETSLMDVCQFLVDKGHAVYTSGTFRSVDLHSFCYSDFDIKVGCEEQVYVTFIYSTGIFYCQLAKNTSAIEAIMKNVSEIGEKIQQADSIRKKNLCIVKYFEDGNFYRTLTMPVESSSFCLAFFVDFGNSQLVVENATLPIPEDATDILFEPMQAIQCCLFGLNDHAFTADAKNWFEEHCIGKPLNAVIVAKDTSGQLTLELYDGEILINEKIKELLGMSSQTERPKASKPNGEKRKYNTGSGKQSDKHAPNAKETRESMLNKSLQPGNLCHPKPDTDCSSEASTQTVIRTDLTLTPTSCESPSLNTIQSALPKETSFGCSDVPQVDLEPGATHMGYISHINSPSDFYIQVAEHERRIALLVDDLNKESISFQALVGRDVTSGKLVVTQYPDDLAFYRAVVTDVGKDKVFVVEFIDYGNTATVDCSSIFKLPDTFLSIPRLSVHASLSGLEELQTDGKWSKDVISSFCERVSSQLLSCSFLSLHGKQWKVNLSYSGQSIAEELLGHFKPNSSKNPSSFQTQNSAMGNTSISKTDENEDFDHQSFLPGQLESVKHFYVSDQGRFFVTLKRNSQESNLISLISATVKADNNRLLLRNIVEGMNCLAKSNKMQTWFRASVVEIYPRKMQMLVYFVDHGASEVISVHNAKVLAGDLLSIPKQAIACKWTGAKDTEGVLFKEAMLLNLEEHVQVIFLDFLPSEKAWEAEIFINGSLFKEQLLNRANSISGRCRTTETPGNPGTELLGTSNPLMPVAKLQFLKLYSGFVTAAHDPSDFYLQLDDSLDAMNNLSLLMHDLLDNIPSLPDVALRPGITCLLKCFSKKEWCRVEIVNITNGSIMLHLLDYGISKLIFYSDRGKLKILPKDLAQLPALTYHCTLEGVTPSDGSKWSKEAIVFFVRFVEQHNLMFQIIKARPNNHFEACVYGEGEGRLCYKLVSAGHAKYDESRNQNACPKDVNANMTTNTFKPQPQVEINKHNATNRVQRKQGNLNELQERFNSVVQLENCRKSLRRPTILKPEF
ncbi:tudor domain-containing protein 15 [Pelodytes ibericus]